MAELNKKIAEQEKKLFKFMANLVQAQAQLREGKQKVLRSTQPLGTQLLSLFSLHPVP